jgi:hypothetical protein
MPELQRVIENPEDFFDDDYYNNLNGKNDTVIILSRDPVDGSNSINKTINLRPKIPEEQPPIQILPRTALKHVYICGKCPCLWKTKARCTSKDERDIMNSVEDGLSIIKEINDFIKNPNDKEQTNSLTSLFSGLFRNGGSSRVQTVAWGAVVMVSGGLLVQV